MHEKYEIMATKIV